MLTDNPIETKSKDLLGRIRLAEKITDSIKSFVSNESIAIGVESEWGYGKTSFVNLIIESLKDTEYLIIKFNPWNFSSQDEIIKDFFDSINYKLKKEKDIIKIFRSYIRKLLKNGAKTKISTGVNIGLLFLNFEVKGTKNGVPSETQKEEMNKTLEKINKRIVFVIDDIDRLDREETKTVFKLVKNTARFKNIIFLLTYDRKRVCEQISDEESDGEEFLKKIIQVRFFLPKPEKQFLFKILISEINSVIGNTSENDRARFQNLFDSGFKDLFTTIRDINRYINSIKLNLAIIGREEINLIDLIGVEAIRVFAPDVYHYMIIEKNAFIDFDSKVISINSNQSETREIRRNICESIIVGKSPKGLSNGIRAIIYELFPQCRGLYFNEHYTSDWVKPWRKELRACSKYHFDKYFSLSMPSTSINVRE